MNCSAVYKFFFLLPFQLNHVPQEAARAERASDPAGEYEEKKAPPRAAAPRAMSSWFGSTVYPKRRAKIFPSETVMAYPTTPTI